jgi:hypothetical protein
MQKIIFISYIVINAKTFFIFWIGIMYLPEHFRLLQASSGGLPFRQAPLQLLLTFAEDFLIQP